MSDNNGEAIARHYENAYQRIATLVTDLGDAQLATPVPSTPKWAVHDVLAHLAAVASDAVNGRLTGRPTDEFTAAQVAARKDASTAELLDEWRTHLEPMLAGARAGFAPNALAVDAVTHEQDMRGALGAGRVPDADAIRFCVQVYTGALGRGLSAAEVPALRLRATDADLDAVAGDGEPAAEVAASEYEFFRAIPGRRGRKQVEAYEWSGAADPGVYLDRFNIFGALPDYVIAD